MNAVKATIVQFADDIARLSARLGCQVLIDVERVADRSDALTLQPPGEWSANRSCRLLRAEDGWIAVSLPRPSDAWLVPAWIGSDLTHDPWKAIEAAVPRHARAELLQQAHLLGLAVAGVREIEDCAPAVRVHRMASVPRRSRGERIKVIDLSSLWAGPLCGSIFASMGAAVLKVESGNRPDPVRNVSPQMFDRLNGQKTHQSMDLEDPSQIRTLGAQIAAADVLITSARPRAFEQIGLAPHIVFNTNPGLVWVAITGYGWTGEGANRIGFGDDAAAAGGLLRWTRSGLPRFIADAVADPLTGLAAAGAALEALADGGGQLIDAALARTAASVAAFHATEVAD